MEYALAWQAVKAETCTGCGEPRAESFDPANARSYEVRALRCHACAARDDHSAAMAEDEHADTGGLFLTVHKT